MFHSGYGLRFREIGERFGGFDLVMLDRGQYDDSWPYNHITPEEAAKSTEDLKAKALLPSACPTLARGQGWLVTPTIGKSVDLENERQIFTL